MQKPIYISGIGIITSIGNNTSENVLALQAGRPGIGKISLLDTIYRDVLPAGEIKLTDNELANLAGVEPVEGLTRTALLGMIAAGEAIGNVQGRMGNGEGRMRNGEGRMGNGKRTGIISGSTVGGMGSTEKYYLDYLNSDHHAAWIDSNESSDSTERIANYLGIKDFVSTINTACSSSANAIMTGARMIRAGFLDRVIVGGTDALTIFTLNGFNTLMIYDREPCKPFDEHRNGLNLGEGAAYLVLESEESLGNRVPLCVLSGYGNSTDAHHQTALSPEGTGPYMAMKQALELSGLKAEDISYVNVHGTATINNDLSESMAMKRIFGDKMPLFSSTKPYTGHLLGSSGAVEAVFSVLSIMHDTAWPNLNFSEPIREFGHAPVKTMIQGSGIRHVLSNSFGFGGNNNTLIFSKV